MTTSWYADEARTQTVENDVVFNSTQQWDSYRGPLHVTAKTRVADFHRVALHEFGHVLGLAHAYTTTGLAIMETTISDLDHLADDDIAGVTELYGLRITSALYEREIEVGTPYSYQVTANNFPTSFSAVNLPAGITIDPSSGWIRGVPSVVGSYSISLFAHGFGGDATVLLPLKIVPRFITSISVPVGRLGQHYSFQITADNDPTSFAATDLPPGLSINPNTGLISGVPTASGTYYAHVIAHGSIADAVGDPGILIEGPFLTSNPTPAEIEVGVPYVYQIAASNHPLSFAATGLPAGLQLDPASGVISGTPTLNGSYSFTVVAHGSPGEGDATGVITLPVLRAIDGLVATFPSNGGLLVMCADPLRPRVYLASIYRLVVIDTNTLTVARILQLPFPISNIAMSKDGSKLWVVTNSTVDQSILSIDLESFVSGPYLANTFRPVRIREGLSNHLYATDGYGNIAQLDAVTGATQNQFTAGPPGGVYFDVNAAGTELFVTAQLYPASLTRYDISGALPVLKEQRLNLAQEAGPPILSHDGIHLTELLQTATDAGDGTLELLASDFTKSVGTISLFRPAALAYSADDSVFYLLNPWPDEDVGVYDTQTCALLRKFHLGGVEQNVSLVVDGSGRYLFEVESESYEGVRVFLTHPYLPVVKQAPHTLANVSTRTAVLGGDSVEIGGFIIQGSVPKKVLLRAIGPSLANAGVAGALGDPVLELHNAAGGVVAANDNWNAARQAILASGLPPLDEHEAAIFTDLAPGSYTAVLKGLNNASGIALFELYDFAPGNSRIANISTRGMVQAGDNAMIGGFIIGGDQPTKVIARAIGPSLTALGVAGPLADPVLELHDGNGNLMAQNDNWRSEQEQTITATGLAPSDNREAALVRTLAPGSYTAIVRGAGNSTGVALVEIYNLEP